MSSPSITTGMRGTARPHDARLIAIEGASGVGKTTAVAMLARSLPAVGSPLTIKLPSAGPLGTLARELLEQGLRETVALTAAADRAFVAEVEITPALAAGRPVIVDRYVMSALALNRLGGITFEDSFALCARLPRPDLSVLLVSDPHAIAERLGRRDQLDPYERGDAVGEQSEQDAFRSAAEFLRSRDWRIAQLDASMLDPTQTVAAISRAITDAEAAR